MKRRVLVIICCLMYCCCAIAQTTTFNITDKQPAQVDGLEMGYFIKSSEVKAVSDKGDFSRYSVNFYVRNTTNQAKIMLYKQGLNILGNVSNQLAQFNCLNATGARLTSKEAIINAEACNVLAQVDNNCDPKKTRQEKRFVQIGYWIKPGQTISTNAILITPLNTMPDMQVTYLASQLTPLASASNDGPPVVMDQPVPPPSNQAFIHLRNNFNNTYLNNQVGPPQSTKIDNGWWSAQWQIVNVPGSRMVSIKNRWKGNYVSVDLRGYVTLTDNPNARSATWSMEPTNDQGVFRFRNLASGGYLCIASTGVLIQSGKPDNTFCSGWLLEQF